MASIYEFQLGFRALWDLIEDETLDDEVIEDVFQNMTDDLKDKLENCCKYLKNLDSDIAGLKEEEKRIKAKRQSLENSSKRLKALMFQAQKLSGEKKLVCGTFTTSIQNNPPSVVLDVESIKDIPEVFIKYAEPEVDKAKIKEELSKGVELSFAHLEQSESLRIR